MYGAIISLDRLGSMALVLAISGHQYQVNNGLRRSPVTDSDSGHYPQFSSSEWRGAGGILAFVN